MAAFNNTWRIFLCILCIYLINLTESKRNKQRHNHFTVKCTRGFLWEALTAAGKGNNSATNFLANELDTLGFTKDGIRSKSIASNWQSKLHIIATKSIFSNLQKLGMMDLTATQYEQTDKVEIVPLADIRKAEKSSYDINMKHLVREINRLYTSQVQNAKIRNKKLRKILKKFLTDDMLCSDKKSRKPPEKKNKETNQGVDSIKICLNMIKELMDLSLCDDVNESFHWTYSQVFANYKKKSSFLVTTVTDDVPKLI